MKNHSEIADLIKDDYDSKDYENVILPFTLLRRLDCVLEGTYEAVQETEVPGIDVQDLDRSRLREFLFLRDVQVV